MRFLDHLAEHGNVRMACAAVGLSAEAAYKLRRRDLIFAEGWATALVLARAHAEQVLADRALNGVDEQIWYRGELVGSRRRFDGRLLLAHLARLDRLADETIAGPRAARFDEMLALVTGETFPADMADRAEGYIYEADPLLPIARNRHVIAAAQADGRRARDEALEAARVRAEERGRRDPDWDEDDDPENWFEPEDLDAIEAAEAAGEEAGHARGAAEQADWRARSTAIVAQLDAGPAPNRAEAEDWPEESAGRGFASGQCQPCQPKREGGVCP